MKPFAVSDFFDFRRSDEPQQHQETEECSSVSAILENVIRILDHLLKLSKTHERRLLEQAEEEYASGLKTSLPYAEKIMRKKEKSVLDVQFLDCLPSLQRLGIALGDLLGAVRTKVKTETAFTDKALSDITDVTHLIRSLAVDTRDVLLLKNQDFKGYVEGSARNIRQKIEECDLEHENRLLMGTCSPKASYLYLDIMTSLKAIVNELVILAKKA
jgi:Na+/phosphate symporter